MTSLGTKRKFERPPDAPVFNPTEEEFSDPLRYISKIKHIGEKAGIIKIVPPRSWRPPFCVNIDDFKFTPRVQKLNELEAGTRIKLNFLERLSKFWMLQGTKFKIPNLERKPIDLYRLNKLVHNLGGFQEVCETKRWSYISEQMAYKDSTSQRILKTQYEKLIYPYDVFLESTKKKRDGLKRKNDDSPISASGKKKHNVFNSNEIENIKCKVCENGSDEAHILLCDECDFGFHTYCLYPQINDIPKGDWRCKDCLQKVYQEFKDSFGFKQSHRDYKLTEFGEYADSFKTEYFKRPLNAVTLTDVETEFWKLLSSEHTNVSVMYGADLHTLEVGSGFPSVMSAIKHKYDFLERYSASKWNLNNISKDDKSLLSKLYVNISGMKIPWVYVGMCFSCFCWHVEDHWSYSINYLHFGEPKTWYGVSGVYAEKLEDAMKNNASELFDTAPDLLHHLVTLMNPNILMKNDVPVRVYRLDQKAGEFVITFPRAYHAGFNQGFNFAEAVNFCPIDWLEIDRLAVENYKQVKRYPVFSHDELIFKIAKTCKSDPVIQKVIEKELAIILENEKQLRKRLNDRGVTKAKKEYFEFLTDDERQCNYCKTTCYLSAIECNCKPDLINCISHIGLCKCDASNQTLKYRFTLNELQLFLLQFKNECLKTD